MRNKQGDRREFWREIIGKEQRLRGVNHKAPSPSPSRKDRFHSPGSRVPITHLEPVKAASIASRASRKSNKMRRINMVLRFESLFLRHNSINGLQAGLGVQRLRTLTC
jgi:hypothetical protein